MLYLLIKASLSGAIVALVAEVSRRFPGLGGLIASLPLVSVLGMIWLWRDTRDPERLAAHAMGTFWFVLPSLPLFLVVPALLKRGLGFYPALAIGCALTVTLYAAMVWAAQKVGVRL